VYYKKASSLLGKVLSHYRWLALFRQAIRRYMIENGKPDLVHVHIPMKAGLLALWVKKTYKIPFVVTEHWGIYNDVVTDKYEQKPRLFKHYTKKIFSKAIKFISVSKYLGEGVKKLVGGKEYEIVPNAVDKSLFYYKEKQDSVFRFIHVSNMVPLKNAEGILRAFKTFSESKQVVKLVMVGDTDPAVRSYATGLEILNKTVFFRGEVLYSQVSKEMQSADCLILFSDIENSPCVIGEALCCGLPVITTRVGGIPELVDDSNAILVEPRNEEQLVNAMQQMIDQYAGYNKNKIAEDATGKFSYSVIGKKMDDIYLTVLPASGNKSIP
jgi:glycosyltransferase involved in cell wall biosynthesis